MGLRSTSRSRRTSPAADAGELVDVPDEQQVGARRHRLDQLVGEQEVEHGGLVHDHQVGVQRPVLVVRRVPARLELQQPVHGGGVRSGQLGESLGGTARRRREHHLRPPGARQLHDRADRERLAAAGAPGEHRDLLGERQPDGLLLPGCQLHARTPLQPGQCLVPGHVVETGHPVLGGAQEAQQLGREGEFGAVEGDQIDGRDRVRAAVGTGDLLAYDARLPYATGLVLVLGRLRQFRQAFDDQARVHLEQLHRVGDQLLLGEEAVALVGGLRQGVLEARLDALGAVVRDADGLGDLVRGEEADAPDVGGQAVGLVLDDRDRRVAVLLVDAHRDRRRHLDGLEEKHDLLDRLLLLPGVGDLLGALGAEAGDLDEALRLLLDDLERVQPEVPGDAVGEDRADALDQAGAEVAADALDGGGQDGRVVLHRELLAVLRVGAPPALHPERLAHLGAEERAHDGEQIAA